MGVASIEETRIARVTEAVFRAMEQVNQARAASQRVERSPEAVLIGPGAALDSLGIVNLVVAIEEEIEDEFGVAVAIADEQARTRPESPFASVRTLAAYIAGLLAERGQ